MIRRPWPFQNGDLLHRVRRLSRRSLKDQTPYGLLLGTGAGHPERGWLSHSTDEIG